MSEHAAPPHSPWRQAAQGAVHRVVHQVLPWSLRLRRQAARSGYERLLADYRLHFLQQRRRYPEGVAYRLLTVAELAPNVRAYRLQAPPGVKHQAGQTLLLNWLSEPAEVQALLQARGWDGARAVRLRSASSAFAPGRWHRLTLAQALAQMIDVREVLDAAPAAVAATASPAAGPPLSTEALETQLAGLPRMYPRSYSVSGIEPSAQGELVEILVTEVDDPAPGGATRSGRCSGHLARLAPGAPLQGWPLAFPLTMGARPQAPVPLLVVATGIAAAGPLFEIQALQLQRPLWLLIGLRHCDPQQPYLQRLLRFAAAHPGCAMHIALSRDSAPGSAWPADAPPLPPNVHWHGHQRVQDVLRAEPARWAALWRAGGDTVVMGHTGMGTDVQAALREMLQQQGLAADAAAARAMQQTLENGLRLQYSLSGR